MITKTQSFSTSDGKIFPTLEGAQQEEINLLVSPYAASGSSDAPTVIANIIAAIVTNREKVIDILTTTAKSRPVSRKIHGGTKKRTPKVSTEVAV